MLKVALIFVLLHLVEPAKILGVFPIPSRTHFNLGFRLMEELVKRGHHVTVVSPFPQQIERENYIDIPIENTKHLSENFQQKYHETKNSNFISSVVSLYDLAYDMTQAFLSDENTQILLKSNQKYDLIVIDYFMNDAVLSFGRHFRAPIVLFSTLPPSTLSNHLSSNPLPSAYVPNILTEFTGTMSYWERFTNLLYNVFNNNYRYFMMLPRQNGLLKKYVNENFNIGEITKDVHLILFNSNPAVTEPVPLSPNMIEIGGFHVNHAKRLPADLKIIMDSSKDGVILFSMQDNFNQEVIPAFTKAFSRIKQKVLWILEGNLTSPSDNVIVSNWIPQQETLGHPNTKAFISVGDLLSCIETSYFGIPLIGIPIYKDQVSNVARAVHHGYAISIDFKELSENRLVQAMKEIMENQKYLKNAKTRSKIVRDQLVEPLDKAMYWLEYVIEHKGSKFLQSPGVQLAWYKKHMIDVIILLVILDVILFLIFYYIFKHIIHRLKLSMRKTKSKDYNKLENL